MCMCSAAKVKIENAQSYKHCGSFQSTGECTDTDTFWRKCFCSVGLTVEGKNTHSDYMRNIPKLNTGDQECA
jgi:hypothetical protein